MATLLCAPDHTWPDEALSSVKALSSIGFQGACWALRLPQCDHLSCSLYSYLSNLATSPSICMSLTTCTVPGLGGGTLYVSPGRGNGDIGWLVYGLAVCKYLF